jgi:hypothetical protein
MPALHLLAVVQLVANKTGLLFEIGSLQLQPLSHTHISLRGKQYDQYKP